ncbi:MAG: hypothetical protein ACLRSW_04590 [Christensenellaceae bacterium]
MKFQSRRGHGRRKVSPPCGVCREYLMQLGRQRRSNSARLSVKTRGFLKSLVPDWWGYGQK